MCGISGIFNAPQDLAEAVLRLQAAELFHRGPDHAGIEIQGGSGLYHCRLSIVDPAGGQQPFRNKENTVFLVANAEIYNHRHLRQVLKSEAGTIFQSENDCETLLHAYLHWGDSFLDRLDGFFALLILDYRNPDQKGCRLEKPRLFAARDPVGVTSLYFSVAQMCDHQQNPRGERFMMFGSELKAVCSIPKLDTAQQQVKASYIATFPPGHRFSTDDLDLASAPTAEQLLDGLSGAKEPRGSDAKDWPGEPYITRYFVPSWYPGQKTSVGSEYLDLKRLREALALSVRKRLMSDVPVAFLLSGGLDSSLVCLAATEYMDELKQKREAPSHVPSAYLRPVSLENLVESTGRLRTYSVGMIDKHGVTSDDIVAARKVSQHLGTSHVEVLFTFEEGITALKKCIRHIETFDVSTVRSSVPLLLLSQRIHQDGYKVVLGGEGSDEIFGGYKYLCDASTAAEFHDEIVSLILHVHLSDTIRINKVPMTFSIETRAPFVDKDLMEEAFRIDAGYKMFLRNADLVDPKQLKKPKGWITAEGPEEYTGLRRLEKYALRAAFEPEINQNTPTEHRTLPQSVLWRRKEQFSDGVGLSWAHQLKLYAENSVSDAEWEASRRKLQYMTARTKEEHLYRRIFDDCFESSGGPALTVARWQAGVRFGNGDDPSGHCQ
ncbi:hypothetical protein EX895_002998 [Sporisorium graminicola]|uniref:asparagine synthase (glutamine-hydrolyzing) n=1 Tax=Sporisorium graminicola TaxID=280036 RepID=A0A4U7KYI1_9BASI|nr:hypothetical protein EX895_002998 [Sporisorium graminicola]TKY87902.1 hypothetical protein EX895_002998 [Sporisorium graminicola]